MFKTHSKHIVHAFLVLILGSLACSLFAPANPTATQEPEATNTPPPAPTNTKRPTSTPKPTITPDVVSTQKVDDFNSVLQSFEERGYINSTKGEIIELEDFKEEWAQMDWYQWWTFDEVVSDVVFKAHFKWSTANETPETSGCGFVFGIQENGNHYSVFLDKSTIAFGMARGTYVYEVGKTKGSGRTNFGNPAEADFVLAVTGQKAFVSVDGEFTEYTLSMDQTTTGQYGLSVLSGTNRDYGTRCEMTDLMMWVPK